MASFDSNDIVVSSGVALFNTTLSPTINQAVAASPLVARMAEAYLYVKVAKVQVVLDPQVAIFDGIVGVSGLAQAHLAHRIGTNTWSSGYDLQPTEIEHVLDAVGGKMHRPNSKIIRSFSPYVMNTVLNQAGGQLRYNYMRAPWFGTTSLAQGPDVQHYCGNVCIDPPSAAGAVAGIVQKYKVRVRMELHFKKPRLGA